MDKDAENLLTFLNELDYLDRLWNLGKIRSDQKFTLHTLLFLVKYTKGKLSYDDYFKIKEDILGKEVNEDEGENKRNIKKV